MSNGSNPYGGGTGGYGAANVTFGTDAAAPAVAQAPVPAAQLVKDTTTADFTRDVIQESRNQPVLVDFWAPWCGPCKQLTPVLEKVVHARGGAVRLVKLNIDDHPAIPGQMGIQSIPAVIAFKNGQPVDGFMGAIPESQIDQFLDKLGATAPEHDAIGEALEIAAERMAAGEADEAARIYDAILQQDPQNHIALSAMAAMLIDNGAPDQAKELIARVAEDKKTAPEVVAIEARIALASQVASLGDPAALRALLAANAKDHQARFDLAMIENALGNRDAAADHLLDIIRTERAWNDEAARKQLLTLFEAWGPTDEATLAARRKLSSLLFS